MADTTIIPVPPPRRRPRWVALGVLAVTAILYASGLSLVREEADFDGTYLARGPGGESFIHVVSTVMTIDAVTGTMVSRLDFVPNGGLAAEDGTLTRDLVLFVNTASGSREVSFKKGHLMNPLDVESLLLGHVADYPFDEHTAELSFAFSPKAGMEPVATALLFDALVTGYSLDAKRVPEPGLETLEITVRRAHSVKLYAVIVMTTMMLLAAAAVVVVRVFYVQRRKIEPTLFSPLAAMLFAFPAMRNTLPGAPPMGALCDYASFFWAEAIVAVSMMAGVYCWAYMAPNVAEPPP